jgi:hypothetical protein
LKICQEIEDIEGKLLWAAWEFATRQRGLQAAQAALEEALVMSRQIGDRSVRQFF